MARYSERHRRNSISSIDGRVMENFYVADVEIRPRVNVNKVDTEQRYTMPSDGVPMRVTTDSLRKRRLRLALSCPGFLSNEPSSPNSPASSIEMSSPSDEMPMVKHTKHSEMLFPKYYTNKNYTTNNQGQTVITNQPTANYKSNQSTRKDVNGNTVRSNTRENFDNRSKCNSCLYRTKSCISVCTCYWCVNAMCYHCVMHDDDIGYTSPSLKNVCSCDGSLKTNLKKLAILASCIPCLPCLTFYPCLDGAVNMLIKWRS